MQSKLDKKIVRMVKKKSPWASHLISDVRVALDLNIDQEVQTVRSSGSRCTACKGARMLCGRARCPILTRIYSYLRVKPLFDNEDVNGSSPPGVFVGRIGYPYVYAGPLVPPFYGDTREFDAPEKWFGKKIEEIIDFRLRLIRGKFRVNVAKPQSNERFLEETRFLAMAESSIGVEMDLKTKPKKLFVLSDRVQPIGPSALIKDLNVENGRLNYRIEKAYYDYDLKAVDAVLELYKKGVAVSSLQKALSMGVFGVKTQRRLVPTRWSITAVDTIVSQKLMEEVKEFPVINEYRVYESNYLDNRFEVIMFPDSWKYEAMEAWYPGTVWNPGGKSIFLFSDWEDYGGRTRYAKMGGCYYAARLAVNERLLEEKRQATVVVLRETHPGYIMPVGVWQVRENVRNALKKTPLKFDCLKEVLGHIQRRFEIPLRFWLENSKILKEQLVQTKLTSYS